MDGHREAKKPYAHVSQHSNTARSTPAHKNAPQKRAAKYSSPTQHRQYLRDAVDCKFYPNCTKPNCRFRHPYIPPCRNGPDCTRTGCGFLHSKIVCRYNPCLRVDCVYKHAHGQKRGCSRKALSHGSSAAPVIDAVERKECLPSSVAESPLFKLPPELRNVIYRFALVTEGSVIIRKSSGFPEPTLLSVNKTLRAETVGIYYDENEFVADVQHYEHATLELVERKAKYKSPHERRPFANYTMQNKPSERNWGNLKSWFRAVHNRQCSGFGPKAGDPAEMLLIVALFKLIVEIPSDTPHQVDSLVERMHPVFVAHHGDWARD